MIPEEVKQKIQDQAAGYWEVYNDSIPATGVLNYQAGAEYGYLLAKQWIPCSERMPPKQHDKYSVRVLVYDEDHEDVLVGYYHFLKEGWYSDNGDWVKVTRCFDVF